MDWRYPHSDSDGSLARPFYTVDQGHAQVATTGTLKVRSGSYLVEIPLTRQLMLEAPDGAVRLGGSVAGGLVPDRISSPRAPAPLQSSQVENRGIRLNWEDRSDNETGFRLYWTGKSAGHADHSFSRTIDRNQESFTEDNLNPGYTYCIRIYAFNRVGAAMGPEVCETLPDVTPPTGTGYRQLAVYNCHTEKRQVHIWTYDLTTGTWSLRGALPAQYSAGGCPGNASPLMISLVDGHSYHVVAVDPALGGCGGVNDPTRSLCQRLINPQPIKGDSDGRTLIVIVDSGIYESAEAAASGRLTRLAYSPTSGFQFTFSDGIIGESYRIQSSPSVAGGSWTDLTNFTYTGPITITDRAAVPTKSKFYRAVISD